MKGNQIITIVLLLLFSFTFCHEKKIENNNAPQNHSVHLELLNENRNLEGRLDPFMLVNNHSPGEYEPMNAEYDELRQALADYNEINAIGGWPILHTDHELKIGDNSQTVSELKKRLAITHDYSGNYDNVFDQQLESAVRNFQERHGLDINGVVTPKTLYELNIPVQERINQIQINMERWRWIPEKLSANYVWINIPEYKLHLIEGNKEIWETEVIVGKATNSTPIFNDEIEYIVFSPSWSIPHNIAYEELLPIIQQDQSYLGRQGMEVYQNGSRIDPGSVDWNGMGDQEIRQFSFRQKPWPTNPLGHVKFGIPNEYDVYLHDTPTSELFNRSQREFSHGCIRVANPQRLAEYLLRYDPTWTPDRINQAMNSGSEQTVKLDQREPVYIVYLTAWIDSKGRLNFRHDIYGHDHQG